MPCPAPPPVIAPTGDEGYATTIETLRGGAHDFLVKSEIGEETVSTAIDFTLERRRLEAEIDEALTCTATPGETGTPFQVRAGRMFARVLIQYMDILDRRIDTLLYGTDPLDKADIEAVTQQLTTLHASSPDAVEIHHVALR